MAHLWRHDGSKWRALALADGPTILRSTSGFGSAWMMFAPAGAGLAVNGEPVRLGLLALRDRDEIRLADGARFFFSSQEIATVEALVDGPSNLRCPRCRRPFEADSLVVRCPGAGCGVIHHQTDRLPCWQYSGRCAVCPQPTTLDEAQRWTPEGL